MKLGVSAVLGVMGVLFLAGCGGTGRFVQRGIDAYNVGEYNLAIEHFTYIDREGYVLNAKGTCRYLAYRGLSLVHLGKRDEGIAYLAKSKEACAPDPRWLPSDIGTEVDATMAQAGGH
jgi:hypothetical protein